MVLIVTNVLLQHHELPTSESKISKKKIIKKNDNNRYFNWKNLFGNEQKSIFLRAESFGIPKALCCTKYKIM